MLRFDDNDNDEEFLWVSDAMKQGVISAGQMMDVACFTQCSSGKGFLCRMDLESGESVYSMAYRKTPTGKLLNQIFEDPDMANDTMIQVKAQDKVKTAKCSTREAKGLVWNLSLDNDPLTLTPSLKRTNAPKKDSSKPND